MATKNIDKVNMTACPQSKACIHRHEKCQTVAKCHTEQPAHPEDAMLSFLITYILCESTASTQSVSPLLHPSHFVTHISFSLYYNRSEQT